MIESELIGLAANVWRGTRTMVMPIDGCSAYRLAKNPVKPLLVVSTTSSPVVIASLAASIAVAQDCSSDGSSTTTSVRQADGSAANEPLSAVRTGLLAAA